MKGTGFRAWGLGGGVRSGGLRVRVEDFGFGVSGLGCMVEDLNLRVGLELKDRFEGQG